MMKQKNLVSNQLPMRNNWPSQPFYDPLWVSLQIPSAYACRRGATMFNSRREAELLPRLRDLGWKADPATSCSTGELCEAVEVMVDLHMALKDASGAGLQNYIFSQKSAKVTQFLVHMNVNTTIEFHLVFFDKESKIAR